MKNFINRILKVFFISATVLSFVLSCSSAIKSGNHRCTAAGILPYTIKQGEVLFLLGLDPSKKSSGGWTDFGGACDHAETPMQTAIREADEETARCYGHNLFAKEIAKHKNDFIQCSYYREYIIRVPFITVSALKKKRDASHNSHCREMIHFAWIKGSALLKLVKEFEKSGRQKRNYCINTNDIVETSSRLKICDVFYKLLLDLSNKMETGKTFENFLHDVTTNAHNFKKTRKSTAKIATTMVQHKRVMKSKLPSKKIKKPATKKTSKRKIHQKHSTSHVPPKKTPSVHVKHKKVNRPSTIKKKHRAKKNSKKSIVPICVSNTRKMPESSIWLKMHQGQRLSKDGKKNLFKQDCLKYASLNKMINQKNPSAVRVATYNVHYWTDPMGQGNFKGIINTIAALHADIIMLQEVNWGASIFNPMTAWQLKKVFEDLGYTYQLFGLATTSIYGAPFGNLLLSKYPLQQTYVKNFNTNELSHGEGRCYVHALVTLPKGKQLSVYDTHMDVFDVTGAVRLAQIKELTTQIASDKCPNVLLAADFNEVRIADYRGRKLLWDLLVHDNKLRNEPTPTAVASRLIDFYDCFTYAHQRVPTFSVWNGTTIDFMYVRKGWKLLVVGCYTYFSAASDHMPIVMDVLVK